MKTCAYCGRENEDAATACAECGTENFGQAPGPAAAVTEASPKLAFADLASDPMRIFRALVLVSLSTYVICYFETTWADPFLSRESQTLLGWDGYNQAWEIPRSVFRLQAALFVVSMVGLFWFLRSARMLYAWLLVAFAIESLIRGMGVSTPLGGLLAYVGVMADGAILSMAFLHPLKTRFV